MRDGTPALRKALRSVSFSIVLLTTMADLLVCWRQHFSPQALRASGITIAISIYFANHCYRRSRGWASRMGPWLVSPEDDPDDQDMKDKGILVGIAFYILGVAQMIFQIW